MEQIRQERFAEACQNVIEERRQGAGGIGTLGEKTLHAVLKWYMEPYGDNHEIKVGSYVADIVGENGIVEIQTRSFDKLRRKLDSFLPVAPVTVVYPIAASKWICWIEPETGEVSSRRKSPKHGCFNDCFYELYKIKMMLNHPNLSIHLLLLDMDEYRNLNGWSEDKKRGASRHERIPLTLVDEVVLSTAGDYLGLIPQNLPERFTSRDYKEASGLSLKNAQTALNVLRAVDAVENTGKQGRLLEYRRKGGEESL